MMEPHDHAMILNSRLFSLKSRRLFFAEVLEKTDQPVYNRFLKTFISEIFDC